MIIIILGSFCSLPSHNTNSKTQLNKSIRRRPTFFTHILTKKSRPQLLHLARVALHLASRAQHLNNYDIGALTYRTVVGPYQPLVYALLVKRMPTIQHRARVGT